jgi:hypothetical protein
VDFSSFSFFNQLLGFLKTLREGGILILYFVLLQQFARVSCHCIRAQQQSGVLSDHSRHLAWLPRFPLHLPCPCRDTSSLDGNLQHMAHPMAIENAYTLQQLLQVTASNIGRVFSQPRVTQMRTAEGNVCHFSNLDQLRGRFKLPSEQPWPVLYIQQFANKLG